MKSENVENEKLSQALEAAVFSLINF